MNRKWRWSEKYNQHGFNEFGKWECIGGINVSDFKNSCFINLGAYLVNRAIFPGTKGIYSCSRCILLWDPKYDTSTEPYNTRL